MLYGMLMARPQGVAVVNEVRIIRGVLNNASAAGLVPGSGARNRRNVSQWQNSAAVSVVARSHNGSPGYGDRRRRVKFGPNALVEKVVYRVHNGYGKVCRSGSEGRVVTAGVGTWRNGSLWFAVGRAQCQRYAFNVRESTNNKCASAAVTSFGRRQVVARRAGYGEEMR